MFRKMEDAVSPVVGVMLMLVIVIIIAAVVSGFSGGLMGNQEKAPLLAMDVHISNNGYWSGSAFSARVTGVESAIPTKDLKIVTSWTHVNTTSGSRTSGGATVYPNRKNTDLYFSWAQGSKNMGQYNGTAPWGYGPGVIATNSTTLFSGEGSSTKGAVAYRYFGNYSLEVGSVMYAEPFGASTAPYSVALSGFSLDIGYGVNGTPWVYVTGYSTSQNSSSGIPAHFCPYEDNLSPCGITTANNDGMMAVLGKNWNDLRPGDVVTVSIVHTPSGKTIWQKEITVEG